MNVTGFFYKNLIKPIFFCFPADKVHEFILRIGYALGRYKILHIIFRKIWSYHNPILKQKISGLAWENPIGLSAGFDYNADLINILPVIGFGFHSVGTLTNEAYQGNPAPMLDRLPKSKSLLVNKGFKNAGIRMVLPKLIRKYPKTPCGVSIGATNKPYATFEDMVDDMLQAFKFAETQKNFDYFELNISCPNLKNIQNLAISTSSPEGLSIILESLSKIGIQKPLYLKLPLERTHDEFKKLVDVAVPFSFVQGLIISNLAKNRKNPNFNQNEIKKAGLGNFSGKPTEKIANDLIYFARKTYKNRFVIIGVGGVFSPEDAYLKIKNGANLVQLITGMVYEGPQLIGQINKGLANFLKRDGYKSIKEAVGTASY